MAISFGTNLLANATLRRLNEATTKESSVFERLSSGLRINSASDDAAGLSVASSLNAQSRIYSQAILNFQDGISAVSVVEGTLNQLSNITQREQELATQAASSVLSSTQRTASQKEADALTTEFDRLVQTTRFNGRDLLTNNLEELRLQGGIGVENSLAITLGKSLAIASPAPTSASANSGQAEVYQFDFNGTTPTTSVPEVTNVQINSSIPGTLGTPDTIAPEQFQLQFSNGATYSNSPGMDGFTVYDSNHGAHNYYFIVDGADPQVPGATGIYINYADSPDTVAAAAYNVLASDGQLSTDYSFTTGYVSGVLSATANSTLDFIDPTVAGNIALISHSDPSAIAGTGTADQFRDPGYFTIDSPGQSFYVYFNVHGAKDVYSFDPMLPGKNGSIGVDVNIGDDAATVANDIASQVSSFSPSLGFHPFSTAVAGTDNRSVVITNALPYEAADSSSYAVNNYFSVSTIQQGAQTVFVQPLSINFSDPLFDYIFDFTVNGTGTYLNGGAVVDLGAYDSGSQIVQKIINANAYTSQFAYANLGGGRLQVTNLVKGPGHAPPGMDMNGAAGVTTTQVGITPQIDSTTDTISIASHGLSTGQAVTFSSRGSAPGGLVNGSTYYAIKTSNDTFKLATSKANALAGTAINITSDGTGTQTFNFDSSGTVYSMQAQTISLATVNSSRSALDTLSNQQQRISAELSNVGAFQSRIQVAINNLRTLRLGTETAESQIMSVDVAQETANLVKQQILQQLGTSLLSQVKTQPEIALKLLQN